MFKWLQQAEERLVSGSERRDIIPGILDGTSASMGDLKGAAFGSLEVAGGGWCCSHSHCTGWSCAATPMAFGPSVIV